MNNISRRDFLKMIGTGFLLVVLPVGKILELFHQKDTKHSAKRHLAKFFSQANHLAG